MFTSLRPILRTKNLKGTIEFYTQRLGWAFTGSLYFNVDDVAALWAQLKDVVEIAYPLETFHYGMSEFAIYDNNGYMLQFGTPASV